MRVDATTAFVTALQAPLLRPAYLVSMTFAPSGSPPSTTVNLWTGLGTLTWNGMTFNGVGNMGSVATVEEGSTVQARGTTLTLSGIDPTLLGDALTEVRQGLPVTIWFALFDSTPAIIANPVVAFQGRMDQPTITCDGATATIQINCESRLMDLNVPAQRRYTNEDQWRDFPGDRGFEYVNSVQEVTIYWGRTPNSTNNL
jgi:hypothetical protein